MLAIEQALVSIVIISAIDVRFLKSPHSASQTKKPEVESAPSFSGYDDVLAAAVESILASQRIQYMYWVIMDSFQQLFGNWKFTNSIFIFNFNRWINEYIYV